MTSDEYRAKCIEAMVNDAMSRTAPGTLSASGWWGVMDFALRALHGIARVDPIEATEEMLAERHDVETDEQARMNWRDMSAAGDLTNPPEGK